MEDTHICITNLAEKFGCTLLNKEAISFYGVSSFAYYLLQIVLSVVYTIYVLVKHFIVAENTISYIDALNLSSRNTNRIIYELLENNIWNAKHIDLI